MSLGLPQRGGTIAFGASRPGADGGHGPGPQHGSGDHGDIDSLGKRFLQVLEGPVPFVNELLGKILRDERHTRLELLSYEQVALPLFHDWSMTVLCLEDVPAPARDLLVAKYDLENGAIRVPDDSVSAHSLLLDARWICSGQAIAARS